MTKTPAQWLLSPVSVAYGLGILVWKGLYRCGVLAKGTVGIPVVSVGNVTVGGNGKTPLTIALCCLLEKRGHIVGILSRGYGRKKRPREKGVTGSDVLVFSAGRRGPGIRPFMDGVLSDTEESDEKDLFAEPVGVLDVGDEPALLAQKLPNSLIGLSSDRFSGARRLQESGASVILMDDGFQSLELAQDVSLVLMAEADFGKMLTMSGWGVADLLPGGPFREGVDGLRRATGVVVTLEGDLPDAQKNEWTESFRGFLKKHSLPESMILLFQKMEVSGIVPFVSGQEKTEKEKNCDKGGKRESLPLLPPEMLFGKRVVLVSGIARPERFSRLVASLGAVVLGHLAWKDHAPWTEGREGEILHFLKTLPEHEQPEMILTTEKDRVKWPSALHLPYTVHSLVIESHLDEPMYWEALLPEIPEGTRRSSRQSERAEREPGR